MVWRESIADAFALKLSAAAAGHASDLGPSARLLRSLERLQRFSRAVHGHGRVYRLADVRAGRASDRVAHTVARPFQVKKVGIELSQSSVLVVHGSQQNGG